METYVYADILFLLNLCMNFAVLSITGRLFRKKPKLYRPVLGAAFAALIYSVFFCFGFSGVSGVITGGIGLVGGIAICFMPVRLKEFGLLVLGALTLTMAIGGGCMAVYYGFLTAGTGFSVWILIFAVIAAYAAIQIVFRAVKRRNSQNGGADYRDISISLTGRQTHFRVLVDTGHDLREPISRRPVIIAEFSAIAELFPENITQLFRRHDEDDLEHALEAFQNDGLSIRMRLIPYRSIGKKNGVLIGFRPDGAEIEGCNAPAAEVIVAVYNGALSAGGEYSGLISTEILENERK